ncbi:hypothetical protein NM208_g13696 [Fusarium decemcellulare]|uniref:Uncharacterized protein n=1 Tax=Fusarium decemcellulare TaxID=57161 RepID=A0ACC1RN20_9HYPO|nr:hypothetical protein NM208_g13696 [Fusarium decemcellulare]
MVRVVALMKNRYRPASVNDPGAPLVKSIWVRDVRVYAGGRGLRIAYRLGEVQGREEAHQREHLRRFQYGYEAVGGRLVHIDIGDVHTHYLGRGLMRNVTTSFGATTDSLLGSMTMGSISMFASIFLYKDVLGSGTRYGHQHDVVLREPNFLRGDVEMRNNFNTSAVILDDGVENGSPSLIGLNISIPSVGANTDATALYAWTRAKTAATVSEPIRRPNEITETDFLKLVAKRSIVPETIVKSDAEGCGDGEQQCCGNEGSQDGDRDAPETPLIEAAIAKDKTKVTRKMTTPVKSPKSTPIILSTNLFPSTSLAYRRASSGTAIGATKPLMTEAIGSKDLATIFLVSGIMAKWISLPKDAWMLNDNRVYLGFHVEHGAHHRQTVDVNCCHSHDPDGPPDSDPMVGSGGSYVGGHRDWLQVFRALQKGVARQPDIGAVVLMAEVLLSHVAKDINLGSSPSKLG